MYKLTHISKYWGPALPQHRAKVKHLKNFEIDPHGFSDVGSDSKVRMSVAGIILNWQASKVADNVYKFP